MRILRGKSNLEVSSQGFALFVVGLVLATFLGGAVRTILSSERVHSRIVSELKSRFPRNEFQIGRTEVLLSRGLWPGLGLRLRDVSFRQDVCGKLSFTLDIPQAVLPVDLLSLRHGRVRLGHMSMQDARMHLDYRECPPKVDEPVKPVGQGIRSAVAERGIKPPHLDWKELSRALSGLELSNFQITYERNLTWKLILQSAEVYLGDDMQFQAKMDVQKTLSSGSLNHAVEVEAHGEDQKLEFELKSEFKEGTFKWEGEWDLGRNAAEAEISMVQIPLKDLSSELFQMGFTSQEVKLKTAWLTCKSEWSGDVERFASSPLKVRNCKLEGAYGRVDLEQADVFVRDEVPLKEPARFQVQKLQLQPLIESLGLQVLPAVLARLGVWSGVVHFTHAAGWTLDGLLENAEIVFSNQSVRGKQLVRSIHTQASRQGPVIQGKIDTVHLQDGEFSGVVGFTLSDGGRSGAFDVAIEKLSFSPAIQNILIGGVMAPMKLAGKGGLQGGELSHWNGTFAASDLRGAGWRGEGLEVKSRYIPGSFQVEARAARMTADSAWRFYPQLRVIRPALSEAISWKDLSARMEILRNGGTLNTFAAHEAGVGTPWRARGNWVRDGVFSGTLLVGVTDQQIFALRGEKGGLNVHERQAGESP